MKRNEWIFGVIVLMASPALALDTMPPRLVDLSAAPISPSQLTDGKKEDAVVLLLRAAKRENVTAEGFDALRVRQKARDAALIETIAPNGPVIHALAKAVEGKLGVLLTGTTTTPGNASAVALQMVQSIFLNRRDDLVSLQALYDDKAWRDALRARFDKGEVPDLNVTLNADKRAELTNTALYVHTPGNPAGKIEPAVHLVLTALAHQIGHAGIADITHAGTPIHTQFQTSIAKALPNDPGAKEWLNEWLYLREGRARAVAVDFMADGALVQDAIAQSETTRRARLKVPPPITYAP